MKHLPALLCSLILVSILSTVSWNYHETPPLAETSVQSTPTVGPSQNVAGPKLLRAAKVSEKRVDLMATLLSDAAQLGEGGTLKLPNPIGSPIHGTITAVTRSGRDVIEVDGRLVSPRDGHFLLRKQQTPGKAGPYVG